MINPLRTLKLQNEASKMLILDCLAVLLRMRDRIDTRIQFLLDRYAVDEHDAAHTYDSSRQAEIFDMVGVSYGWTTFLNRRVKGPQFTPIKELDECGENLKEAMDDVSASLDLAEQEAWEG